MLNNKLNWASHVEHVTQITSRRLHILRRAKKIVSQRNLHLLYSALICSILADSPAFIGLPKTLATKLNKIDNRAHRLIYNIPFDAEYDVECGCNKSTIEDHRTLASLKLFSRIAVDKTHTLNSRIPPFSRKRYILPFSRTTKRLNAFFPRTAHLYNDLC